MIEHVYRRAELCEAVDATYVATPDEEIRQVVEEFGGRCLTTGSHPGPISRVAAAARSTKGEVVVVVQGDEPLVHPDAIEHAIDPLRTEANVSCTNLGIPIGTTDEFENPDIVKVVVNFAGDALLFTRRPVPYLRNAALEELTVYRQVCVMAFRTQLLFQYPKLEPTPLSTAELVDMLRLLEHGHDVRIVETDRRTRSVESPRVRELVSERMAADDLVGTY